MPFPRGQLVRHELYRYFIRRHGGQLDPQPSMLDQALRPNQKLPKPPQPAHPLCPERVTMEVFLAGMVGYLSMLVHTSSAVFQAIPAWLRFLESRGLIDADVSPERGEGVASLARGAVADVADLRGRSNVGSTRAGLAGRCSEGAIGIAAMNEGRGQSIARTRIAIRALLKDKQAQTFPINPGRHRIKVRRDFFRSQVLEFDLSARQGRIEFECGFNRVRPWYRSSAGRAGLIAGCVASAFAVAASKLPSWSAFVMIGVAVVAMGIGWWRCYIPAGAYLDLRRVTNSNGRAGRS